MIIRTGFGYDVHKLVEGRELWLGGIRLDYPLGLLGHSDADVLIHAICDALLGAANMRDIGYHFPDTAAETLNVDSKILLRKTIELIATKGYRLGNIDATVCAERPKLNPHIPDMQRCLADVMQTAVPPGRNSVPMQSRRAAASAQSAGRRLCALPRLSDSASCASFRACAESASSERPRKTAGQGGACGGAG